MLRKRTIVILALMMASTLATPVFAEKKGYNFTIYPGGGNSSEAAKKADNEQTAYITVNTCTGDSGYTYGASYKGSEQYSVDVPMRGRQKSSYYKYANAGSYYTLTV